MPTSTVDSDGSRLLSIAAHLVMLAVVLAATGRRAGGLTAATTEQQPGHH